MIELPDELADIFRELSRGRHLSAQDGRLYEVLEERPDDYITLFAKLGFALKHDARGFYYLDGSARGMASNVQRLALFVFIFIDWLADSGENIVEALSGKAFAIDALPHLTSERYRGYLSRVDVTTANDLADVIRNMDNFGFAKQMGDGFRFLPPVHRIVDACVAAKPAAVSAAADPADTADTTEDESC